MLERFDTGSVAQFIIDSVASSAPGLAINPGTGSRAEMDPAERITRYSAQSMRTHLGAGHLKQMLLYSVDTMRHIWRPEQAYILNPTTAPKPAQNIKAISFSTKSPSVAESTTNKRVILARKHQRYFTWSILDVTPLIFSDRIRN